jgi:hypothetical protein
LADIDGVYLVFDFHVGDDGEQKRDFVLVKSDRKEDILRIKYSFSDLRASLMGDGILKR